jgi:predicted dehydrogenase
VSPGYGGASPVRHVLIVGLGGAGQRHARVFRSLLGRDGTLASFRVLRTTPLLDESLSPIPGSVEEQYGLRPRSSLEEGLRARPDVVVVANPTALHLEAATAAAAAGCHVFVEKPLSHTLEGVEELLRTCETTGATLYVGYQRRFHPAFRLLQHLLRRGTIGSLLSASFAVRSYVPAWHGYQSHRELYALRPDLGGGVLLTESHELDLCHELFGLPSRVFAVRSTPVDALPVDDTVHVVLDYRRERHWPVSLDLSFMTPHARRGWELVGSEGAIEWREGETHSTVHLAGGEERRMPVAPTPGDELFARQAKAYLAALAGRRDFFRSERAVGALVIADAARRSLDSGRAEEPQP